MLTAVSSSTITELLLDHLFLPKGSKSLNLGITVSLGEHKLKAWRQAPGDWPQSYRNKPPGNGSSCSPRCLGSKEHKPWLEWEVHCELGAVSRHELTKTCALVKLDPDVIHIWLLCLLDFVAERRHFEEHMYPCNFSFILSPPPSFLTFNQQNGQRMGSFSLFNQPLLLKPSPVPSLQSKLVYSFLFSAFVPLQLLLANLQR